MFEKNRRNLQEKINNGVAIIHSGSILQHPNSLKEIYRSDSNFYYITGLSMPDCIAVITSEQFVVFAPSPDPLHSQWDGPRPSLEELKSICGANEVWDKDLFVKKIPDYLFGKEILYHTFRKNREIYDQVFSFISKNKEREKKIPHIMWDIDNVIVEMRVKKTEDEIEKIRKAVSITKDAYMQIFSEAKPGFFEHEIEAILQHVYIKNGCRDAFPPIVGSGPNATILHYRKNDRQIKSGEMLLVDSGAEYQHYCADVSRAWAVDKKFSSAQKNVYQKLLTMQKNIIMEIKPGANISQWIQKSDHMIAELLVELGFIKGDISSIVQNKQHKQYYPHSLNHWLGLDVHDIGHIYKNGESRVFETGMVLTVEPGIYIPLQDENVPSDYRGIGIRIEDDILVTENGHENLTKDIPKEIEFFENL